MVGTLWWLGASLAQGIVSMALFVGAIWAGSAAGARWGRPWGWLVGIAALAVMIVLFEAAHDAILLERCDSGTHHHGCAR